MRLVFGQDGAQVRPAEDQHTVQELMAQGMWWMCHPSCRPRTRMFATGQGRKTDATDAHSVALAATRMQGLRPAVDDQQLAVLRILADRRRSLGEDHTRMVCQLHRLLLELIPGGAKKALSAALSGSRTRPPVLTWASTRSARTR